MLGGSVVMDGGLMWWIRTGVMFGFGGYVMDVNIYDYSARELQNKALLSLL